MTPTPFLYKCVWLDPTPSHTGTPPVKGPKPPISIPIIISNLLQPFQFLSTPFNSSCGIASAMLMPYTPPNSVIACKGIQKMALALSPEFGIEIPDDVPYMDLRVRAEAACNTIKELEKHGLDTTADDVDKDVASTLLASYAADIEKTSKTVNHSRLAELTPASIIQTNEIIKEFGQVVAAQAADIRNTVVNKLILETENTDPRIRIRALELLGKMTDIGLFTDRKEITVTHQNADELREKLREKLEVLKKNADGVYEVVEDESSA